MKRVLITGVSRGIGKAIAQEFLQNDWYVIGTSTSGKASIKHEKLTVYKLNLLKKRKY